MHQWGIAATCPPHLVCIAPWECTTDLYRESLCEGGVPALAFNEFIAAQVTGPNGVDDQVAMAKMYPDMHAYWNDKRADVGKVKIPVYQTAGWSYFHLPDSFNAWRRCRSHLKWMRAHRDFEWPDTYNPESLEDLLRYYVSRATVDTALTKAHTPVYTMTDTNKLAEGEVRTVDIAIVPTTRVYHKGERFRVQISGRYIRDCWFEPLSRDTENHGTHNIQTGGERESWIEVSVVPTRYQAGEYIHR